MNFRVDVSFAGDKRGEWQPDAQILQAVRKAGTERSQADYVTIEGRDNLPGRSRFERNMGAEPSG